MALAEGMLWPNKNTGLWCAGDLWASICVSASFLFDGLNKEQAKKLKDLTKI